MFCEADLTRGRPMTEAEWLACDDPARSIFVAKRVASARQLRLLAAACCRDIWPLLTDMRSREAVEEIEAVADGYAKWTQDRGKFKSACEARYDLAASPWPSDWVARKQLQATVHAAEAVANLNWPLAAYAVMVPAATAMKMWSRSLGLSGRDAGRKYRAQQHRILLEIFGNPFRPVAFSPSWRTDTVVALAAQMYETRDFDAMPILGDALQDAGCDNDEILNHCRGLGPHVRGCFVVDLVLNKT